MKNTTIVLIILVFYPLILWQPAFTQSPATTAFRETGLPYIQNFTARDYGANTQNWDILQDQRGVLYVANSGGVLEYDGTSWRLIKNSQNSGVSSLTLGKDGRIYVGAWRDLGYLAPDEQGQTTFISLLKKLPPEVRKFVKIATIHELDDEIIFQTRDKLFCWTGDHFKIISLGKNADAQGLKMNGQYFLWQSQVGLKTLVNGELIMWSEAAIFKQYTFDAMLPYRQGEVLFTTRRAGLFIFDGKDVRPFAEATKAFFKKNRIYKAIRLANDNFAIATLRGGLVIIDAEGKLQQIINKDAGLPDNTILSVRPGRQGGLWVGMNKGLARIELPSPFSFYSEKEGFAGTLTTMIWHQEQLYIGTSLGIFRLSPPPSGQFYPAFERITDISVWVFSLLSTDEGILASTNSGLFLIRNGQKILVDKLKATTLYRSRYHRDRVYAATRQGLFTLERSGDRWQFGKQVFELVRTIESIEETAADKLWLGTQGNGCIHVQFSPTEYLSAKLTHYGPEQGIPSRGSQVLNINGRVVFATTKGLRRFDPGKEVFLPDTIHHKTLADTNLSLGFLTEAADGNLWYTDITDNIDIRYQAVGGEKHPLWHESLSRRLIKWDDVTYILPDLRQDGVTWFGSNAGLARFDASIENNIEETFTTLIRQIIVRRDSLLYGSMDVERSHNNESGVSLLYKDNTLRFEYATLSYDFPDENRYQVFLENFDKGWTNWSDETQVDYTNLPEGDYTFRVRAKDYYGQISAEAAYAFRILPPWYRSGWAYFLYSALLAGFIAALVYGYNRWRTQQLQQRTRELEAQVQDRTAELAEKNFALQEMNEMKSRFFANISHEFRTPLTLILGQINNVLPNLKKEKNINHLQMASRNALQLQRLINQLLDLSKFDAHEMTLKAAEQNIVPLLKHLTETFESLAFQRKINLQFEATEADIPVYFEQDKLEKIMHNLLSNALKFTPEGGNVLVKAALSSSSRTKSEERGAGKIEERGARSEERKRLRSEPSTVGHEPSTVAPGELAITVRDSGVGIPADRLPYIFDRFFQVDSSSTREYEGTGIGLALTKELVQIHGGGISVTSEPGFGTTFTVTFPLGDAHLKPGQIVEREAWSEERKRTKLKDREAKNKAQKARDETSTVGLNPLTVSRSPFAVTVLIVDDNPDMRTYIAETLASGYSIIQAANGEMGFEAAKEEIPDLIITDVMMPKVDGYELTRKLREDPITSHIPIIMLTAKAAESDKFEGLEVGVDAFLVKPFNTQELQIRVRKLIELRQKLRSEISAAPASQPVRAKLSSLDQAFLERLQSAVAENIANEHFSVDDLAAASVMSRRQLQRKLKALTDFSPTQYIRSLRMQRAKELLETGEGNVTDAAFSVGYTNIGAFSTAFQKAFGKPPSAFMPRGE